MRADLNIWIKQSIILVILDEKFGIEEQWNIILESNSCLNAINKTIRFECTCPKCFTRIRSDDIESSIFGLNYDEVLEIQHGDELEIECHD